VFLLRTRVASAGRFGIALFHAFGNPYSLDEARACRDHRSRQGLDAGLGQLAADGVYLDINEFKGKKPLIRRGRTRHFSPTELDVAQGASVPIQSSGSSGRPTFRASSESTR
jgi:hypothetical protein